MDFTLTIRFKPSLSKSFDEVIRACRNFEDFHDHTLTIHSLGEIFGRCNDFTISLSGYLGFLSLKLF